MHSYHDLDQLQWNLTGWIPFMWKLGVPVESCAAQAAEVHPVPVQVPGSVQKALLDAGVIKDWNYGTNYRDCQWVENLHWIYEANIPESFTSDHKHSVLNCVGLDGSGWILLNKQEIARFDSSFVPCTVDLTQHLKLGTNLLQIVFDCPPRWLGQFGYTSEITDMKTRFYYTWDWTSRLVQIGVSDRLVLECWGESRLRDLRLTSSIDNRGAAILATGAIEGGKDCHVRVSLKTGDNTIAEKIVCADTFTATGLTLDDLPVDMWWPNLHGDQPVYCAVVELLDSEQGVIQREERQVGFRTVRWESSAGSPENADPWVCVVNDKPIFLQGANWVPIRPNYADITEQDYLRLLTVYKDLGFNLLRVWGGAVLEKEVFYNLCDELGIMVWQEFPLSSSGLDNNPPEEELFALKMSEVARSYIARRAYHCSLILWCGGNELVDSGNVPLTEDHCLLKALGDVVRECDPSRRYLATSPSGPRFLGTPEDFGKRLHWDVHGPWKPEGSPSEWETYWDGDDAMFRSETGCPATSSADILQEFVGDCDIWPIDSSNPYWRRHTNWWLDYENYVAETGNNQENQKNLEAYCQWSQHRQKEALSIAVSACKRKFPACGGIILWMGHDCFPCSANTSIIDFYGRPKPAALAIGQIFCNNE